MYSEKEARELVIKAGLELVEKKLIARTWGNISARVSDTEFVITPSGKAYDGLTVDDLVKIRIRDCSYEGDIKPSSEKGIHAAVYKLRKDCNFVIHTHQFFATAIAAAERDTDFAPCAQYALPGTKQLKKKVEKCIMDNPNSKMFLLAKHGTLFLGSSYGEAFDLAEDMEKRSEQLFLKKVPSMDVQNYGHIDAARFTNNEMKCAILIQDPYIMENCRVGLTLRPYVDDFAQIVGPNAYCCSKRSCEIKLALRNRNAVLIKGVGAICVGKDISDAEAVAMILSKNCACACYVRSGEHMDCLDARFQRYIYLKKYSIQKDS